MNLNFLNLIKDKGSVLVFLSHNLGLVLLFDYIIDIKQILKLYDK